MEFGRVKKSTRFLDPRTGFQEQRVESEVRSHPLTSKTSRVAHFSLREWPKPDLSELVKMTRENCPFCPQVIDRVTPLFPPDLIPEGRLRRGEATVIPNLFPYDVYSALTVMTTEHYVSLADFSAGQIVDAFQVSLAYFEKAAQGDPEAEYCLINWNYMPYSGGSQVHPHLQVYATSTPGNLLAAEIAASKAYRERNGRHFWADFVTREKESGERYIGEAGNTFWLTNFAPLGMLGDVVAVFPGSSSCWDLTPAQIGDFVKGLQGVFRYYDSAGIYSFNLAFYPGPPEQDYFWTHAVISARASINPLVHASDINTLRHLYDEPFTIIEPEKLAQKIREWF